MILALLSIGITVALVGAGLAWMQANSPIQSGALPFWLMLGGVSVSLLCIGGLLA